MKLKLSIVVVVLALFVAASTLSFRHGNYKPRSSSKIDEVLSYQRAGGRSADGMDEYFKGLRANPLTGTVSLAEYMAAVDASMKIQAKRSLSTLWTELGPDNVGGRTRAFLQDIDTPNLMFVGSVSGGLFRSTTHGSSWVAVNDFQENLNVSAIAQTITGTIVYGTGEGEFVNVNGTAGGSPGFLGVGIFRSTDRGRTFARINTTSGFGTINSMAADHRDGNNFVYASTAGGIKRSIDDGITWTSSKTGGSKEIKVAVNGYVYAQSGNNVVRSKDNGVNWVDISPPNAVIGRASIAISPQDPNYVYVMISATALDGVYRSKDGGDTWDKIINAGTSYFDPLGSPGHPQGYYNNVLTVNPLDKDHIIMGGVNLAEWRDGTNPKYIMTTYESVPTLPYYVHADKHVLQWDMHTDPPTLICGNDGGLYFSSDNLKTFTPRNKGFNGTQFYAVSGDYEGFVCGGAQDNGTQYINRKGNTTKSAIEIKGGDGFKSEISTKDNSMIFATTYYGNITRSRDYGKSMSCMWDRRISRTFTKLTDTSKYCDYSHESDWAPFNAALKLWEHPEYTNTEARMFLAKHGQLWMAINIGDFSVEPEWYLLANIAGNSQVWDIEPTPDGNSVFFSNSSNIFRVDGLNSATYYKWSAYSQIPPGITTTSLGFAAGSGRAISSINLDPNNSNIALITLGNYGFANYIYKGVNMLGTPVYTNITSNFPPMPVYDGFINFSNTNVLMVGSDLGVYASDDGGASWTAQTNPVNKFPKVATMALRQYIYPARSSGSIFAGTHGRGFFMTNEYKVNINAVQNNNKSNIFKVYPNPATDNVTLSFNNTSGVESVTFSIMDFSGKTVMVKMVAVQAGANNVFLETNSLKAGIYIINGTVNGKIIGTIKVVIRQ